MKRSASPASWCSPASDEIYFSLFINEKRYIKRTNEKESEKEIHKSCREWQTERKSSKDKVRKRAMRNRRREKSVTVTAEKITIFVEDLTYAKKERKAVRKNEGKWDRDSEPKKRFY